MGLGTLSTEERQAALDLALEVRRHRAAAKQSLRKGDITLAEFVATEDSVLAGTRVVDLLGALPKAALVGLALRALEVSPKKTVGGLGPVQRKALLEAAKEDEALLSTS